MKSPKFLLIFIILAALLLSACQAQNAPSAAPEAQRGSVPAASQPSSTYGGKSVESYKAADSGRNVTTTQTDRIVIKNANLSIVVEKPFEALDAIISLASQTGGYVVNSRTYKTTSENGVEVPEAEITIRVPSEKLDEALDVIRKLVKDTSKDIRSENITGQDITLEYIDLQSRLATYEQTEKQLLRIMETATKTEDVLNILTRLNDIRQQIESIKGQIKYYDESSKLSAIYVRLVAAEGITPLTIGGWQPLGVARDALQALISIGQFLVNALIVIVIVLLPLFIIFYLPGRWIYRKIRQNRAARTINPYAPIPPQQPVNPPDQNKN